MRVRIMKRNLHGVFMARDEFEVDEMRIVQDGCVLVVYIEGD